MPTESPDGPAAASGPATGRALHLFKDWFWRPPRPHDETIVDRRVSPLELLYDLVYATVIAQAANHLAAHVSAGGLFEFAALFSLTWIAWANGSLYLELHGRSNGRTHTYFFLQIGIIAILAVYAADAGGGGGGFAIAYTAFLVVMTWLWYEVRLQDARVHPEFLADTGRYVVAMAVSVVVILVSALLAGRTATPGMGDLHRRLGIPAVAFRALPHRAWPRHGSYRFAGGAFRNDHDHRPGRGGVRRR